MQIKIKNQEFKIIDVPTPSYWKRKHSGTLVRITEEGTMKLHPDAIFYATTPKDYDHYYNDDIVDALEGISITSHEFNNKYRETITYLNEQFKKNETKI
jgi:hypothetical protein